MPLPRRLGLFSGRLALLRGLALALPALAASLLALVILPSSGSLAAAPTIGLDSPAESMTSNGSLDVIGWAIDVQAEDGTGIDRVQVFVDDVPVKDASYGDARTDIGQAYGPRFVNSGFHAGLDIGSVAGPGTHSVEVRAHATTDDSWTSLQRSVQVAGGPRFCVNTHLLWYGLQRAASDLDRARANGLTAVRFDIGWDSLEPAPGQFEPGYVARLDAVMGLIGDRGMRPIVTVLRTPTWARTGGDALTPPDHPADYANAVARLAARYAAVPGMTYEIWNEPNSPVFWQAANGPDPTAYAALLRTTYAQVKAAAPNVAVLGGSLVFNEPAYLTAMLAAGAAGSFDGLSLHPYSRGFPPDDVAMPSRSFSLALNDADGVLASGPDVGAPLWITEMGWSTADVPDSQRADYYRRAVAIVRANPRIAAFCAFELNQGDDSTGLETGLIASDGTPTASWSAYGQAVRGE